jgi:hypothetical protein
VYLGCVHVGDGRYQTRVGGDTFQGVVVDIKGLSTVSGIRVGQDFTFLGAGRDTWGFRPLRVTDGPAATYG